MDSEARKLGEFDRPHIETNFFPKTSVVDERWDDSHSLFGSHDEKEKETDDNNEVKACLWTAFEAPKTHKNCSPSWNRKRYFRRRSAVKSNQSRLDTREGRGMRRVVLRSMLEDRLRPRRFSRRTSKRMASGRPGEGREIQKGATHQTLKVLWVEQSLCSRSFVHDLRL